MFFKYLINPLIGFIFGVSFTMEIIKFVLPTGFMEQFMFMNSILFKYVIFALIIIIIATIVNSIVEKSKTDYFTSSDVLLIFVGYAAGMMIGFVLGLTYVSIRFGQNFGDVNSSTQALFNSTNISDAKVGLFDFNF